MFLSRVVSKSYENKASWQIVVGKDLYIASDQQLFAGEWRTKDSFKSTRRNDGLRLIVNNKLRK